MCRLRLLLVWSCAVFGSGTVLGCSRYVEPLPPSAASDGANLGKPLGAFQLTYYWVADEADFDGLPDTQIYDQAWAPLAAVPSAFARSLVMEGTGRLKGGRLLNYAGACGCAFSPCFVELGEAHPWGMGVEERALAPFRSVAVDPSVVAIGARLYVANLAGVTVPGEPPWGGFQHDGCVVADDRGGAIVGRHLDFFSASRSYFQALDQTLKVREVSVYEAGSHCP